MLCLIFVPSRSYNCLNNSVFKVLLLLFLCYLDTFNIDDEAAFGYSACFGETSRINGSEFLKKLGRLTLRFAGEAVGCDS